MNVILYILYFILHIQNPVWILHLWHISIQICLWSALWLHVAAILDSDSLSLGLHHKLCCPLANLPMESEEHWRLVCKSNCCVQRHTVMQGPRKRHSGRYSHDVRASLQEGATWRVPFPWETREGSFWSLWMFWHWKGAFLKAVTTLSVQ